MIVQRMAPHPRLAGLVRHYQARSAEPGEPVRRIALGARTDVLLEFYFTAPHLLELQASMVLERAPRVAAVGPQTFRRLDLILAGRMDIFTIHFTPLGLYTLLGVPMPELADAGVDGAGLFGTRTMDDWQDQLAVAGSLAARARIADGFILRRLGRREQPRVSAAVAQALTRIGRAAGADRTGTLARTAGLSERQFRRLFEQQIGVAPKKYARIVRLEAAMAIKARAPDRSWTDIAHDLGWFDQAHMDKDFQALTGAAPSRQPAR